jgi:hypothetical protein
MVRDTKVNRYILSIVIILLCVSILFINGCCFPFSPTMQGSKGKYDQEMIVTFDEAGNDETEVDTGLILPGSRPFNMGFTPFPYDFTQAALEFTYANINYRSDLVTHHFDNGIPWNEALENSDLSRNIIYDFNNRISRTGKDKEIYLAVTPLSTYRDNIAGYWGESQHMELTGKWKNKSFNDPELIKAYTNYCKFMIEKFNPGYFAYGIEVNMLGYHDPQAFEEYLTLIENVYRSLKESYPDLPVFLTIQLETFINHPENQENIVKSLLPFTDYIAISSYPFGNFADPDDIPDDWFSSLYNLAPEKPVAVAETAYLAEDLTLEIFNGNTIEGNQDYQVEYLDLLLNQMDAIDCKFITWFVVRDYDELWFKMKEQGVDEIFKSWRDTGLIDQDGNPRKALDRWDRWISLPRQ